MTTVISNIDLLSFSYEIEDLLELRHTENFGALVMFDLSKRPLATAKPDTKVFSIAGDNIQDAIAKFRKSETAFELKDSDFEAPVFTVALAFNF